MKKFFAVLVVALYMIPGFSKIRFHCTVGDNMVFQQNSMAVIKGKATPGEKVVLTCSWDKNVGSVVAGQDSTWKMEVVIPEATFVPQWLQAKCGKEAVRAENILFGEVWLCSGQSNMEMPVRGFPSQPVNGSLSEILNSVKYKDHIRLYDVEHRYSDTVLDECRAEWALPTYENVAMFSAVAYIFGSRLSAALDVPVGIVLSSYGGTRIESWMDEGALSGFSSDDYIAVADKPYRDPYKIYNAMVAPVTDIKVRGVVWLQGESNRRNAHVYGAMLKKMVALWRDDRRDSELPFIVVQIAPCPYNGEGELGAARIMEAQFQTVSEMNNAYFVGTSDIGAERFIHFPEKVILGERVCVSALANVYGMSGFPKGNPYVSDVKYEDGKAWVYFSNAERGLVPSDKEIECFELAGPDGVYHPASGKIHRTERNCVIVTSPHVSRPENIRFAFDNWHKVNLYSNEGLPAVLYRSDDIDYNK